MSVERRRMMEVLLSASQQLSTHQVSRSEGGKFDPREHVWPDGEILAQLGSYRKKG